MAKKIDYASMYTLRADGRYMGYWHDDNGRHAMYDRDPERLHEKICAKEASHIPTFGEMADLWETTHVSELSRGTQKTYKSPLNDLRDEFGDVPIHDVAASDINRLMLEEKSKGYSYKHAALKKSVAKQILDYAVINKVIPYNPITGMRVPSGLKKGHVESPEEDDIRSIIANLDKPFGDFVAVLLYTGMRTEKAVALTWGDIDEKKKQIHVHCAVDLHGTPMIKEAKTEAGEREVPLLNPLTPFLQRPRTAKDGDYIFHAEGKLLTRSQISSRWLNWCKAAGFAEQKTYEKRHRGKKECVRTEWRPTITPHQLRHHYATVLFEQEVDELTAKDVMGHKDIETTRKIYTSLRKKHRATEIAKIEKGF
jgi:integrase